MLGIYSPSQIRIKLCNILFDMKVKHICVYGVCRFWRPHQSNKNKKKYIHEILLKICSGTKSNGNASRFYIFCGSKLFGCQMSMVWHVFTRRPEHTHTLGTPDPPFPFIMENCGSGATPSSEKVMVLLGTQKITHICAHFRSHGILYSTPHILYSSAVVRAVGVRRSQFSHTSVLRPIYISFAILIFRSPKSYKYLLLYSNFVGCQTLCHTYRPNPQLCGIC